MVAVAAEHWQAQRAQVTRARSHLLTHRRWTRPQLDYLSIPERLAVWRAGNQVGKSEALAADIVWTARGDHPHREVRPNGAGPVEIMVVSYSHAQMRPLMWKIWRLLSPDEVDPKLSCTKGAGLKGYKEPHISLVSGPGEGSVIYFATYKQGTEALAGPSLDAVFCDEPMSELVYGELAPRLIRRSGTMRITMTPTPDSAPQLWLRDKIEEDRKAAEEEGRPRRWRDFQTTINEHNLTPVGGLIEVPFKTQPEIDEIVADYLADELPMRRDGAWEGVLSDRWLTNFGEHAVRDGAPERGRLWWAIGIDHGAKAGRQCAALVCYNERTRMLWALDEYRSDGRSSTRQDAEAILAMLRRHGLSWKDIDYWVGDRAHGGDLYGNFKSNQELMLEFEHLLRTPRQTLRAEGLRLRTPRKSTGSMRRGYRLLNSMLREGQAVIHARCEGIQESAMTWAGKLQDPAKDVLDAWRYAVERLYDDNVLKPRDRDAVARIE